MRKLAKKEKFCAAAGLVIIGLAVACAVFFFVITEASSITDEKESEGSEGHQIGTSPVVVESKEERNPLKPLETKNHQQPPSKPNSSTSTNSDPASEIKKSSNEAEKELETAVSNLESSSNTAEVPKLVEEAKESFQKAKQAHAKESPDYIDSPTLVEYISNSVEKALEDPNAGEQVMKKVRAVRSIDPMVPFAFPNCDTLEDIREAYNKHKNDPKTPMRKAARKAALLHLSEGTPYELVSGPVIPREMAQLTPIELDELDSRMTKALKEKPNGPEKKKMPVRDVNAFMNRGWSIGSFKNAWKSNQKKHEMFRNLAEVGFRIHNCKEFQEILLSDLPIRTKFHMLHSVQSFHQNLYPPEVIELSPNPAEKLDSTLSSLIYSIILIPWSKVDPWNDLDPNSEEYKAQAATFDKKFKAYAPIFSVNSEADVEPVVRIIRENGVEKTTKRILGDLKDVEVEPNKFYKHVLERLSH